MKTFTILILSAQALPAALAFCCGASIGGQCADGTSGTPCCATQSCNIFCCACGGVCRGSATTKRGQVSEGGPGVSAASAVWQPSWSERDPGLQAFAEADAAGNGNMTMDQYLTYMNVDGQPTVWVDWFQQHDKNGDRVITPDEVGNM